MAQKVQIILEDDLVGGPAEETIRFSLDGVEYQVDLNAENAQKLRESLDPFIRVGSKTNARGRRMPAASRASSGTSSARSGLTAKVREWAKEQGFSVSDRGRIPADLFEKYEAAQG